MGYGEYTADLVWVISAVDDDKRLMELFHNYDHDHARYLALYTSEIRKFGGCDLLIGIPISWDHKTNMIDIPEKTRAQLHGFWKFAKENGVEVYEPFISVGIRGDVEFVF